MVNLLMLQLTIPPGRAVYNNCECRWSRLAADGFSAHLCAVTRLHSTARSARESSKTKAYSASAFVHSISQWVRLMARSFCAPVWPARRRSRFSSWNPGMVSLLLELELIFFLKRQIHVNYFFIPTRMSHLYLYTRIILFSNPDSIYY